MRFSVISILASAVAVKALSVSNGNLTIPYTNSTASTKTCTCAPSSVTPVTETVTETVIVELIQIVNEFEEETEIEASKLEGECFLIVVGPIVNNVAYSRYPENQALQLPDGQVIVLGKPKVVIEEEADGCRVGPRPGLSPHYSNTSRPVSQPSAPKTAPVPVPSTPDTVSVPGSSYNGPAACGIVDGKVKEVCITFSTSQPDSGFILHHPWNKAFPAVHQPHGLVRDLPMLKVPTHQAGGAMFFTIPGRGQTDGDHATKMECAFGEDGAAWCNMSLVDGYTVPVQCVAGNFVWGGTKDLFKSGIPCEHVNRWGGCVSNGRAVKHDHEVPEFFREAVRNGNKYWISYPESHYLSSFNTKDTSIHCHVY